MCPFVASFFHINIMSMRFIHAVMCSSFLLLRNMPVYGYTTMVYSLSRGWLFGSFPRFGIVRWLWLLSMSFGEHKNSFLLGIYLGVEFLGHGVQIASVWIDTAQQFSKVVVQEPSLLISLLLAEGMFYYFVLWLQRFSLCRAMELGMPI